MKAKQSVGLLFALIAVSSAAFSKDRNDETTLVSNPDVANHEDTIGNLEDTVGNHEDTIGNLENTVGNHEDTLGNLEQELSDTNKKIETMKNELAQANLKLRNHEDTIGNLEDTVGNHEDTIGNLEHTIGNHEDTIGNLENTVGNLERELSDTNNKVGKMEKLLQELISRVDNPCLDDPCGPYSECKNAGVMATCSCLAGHEGSPPSCRPQQNLLYLGNSKTVELPSFSPVTGCSVPNYPVTGLTYAVTGIVNGDVMICGGFFRGSYLSSCHSLVGGVWTSQPRMQKKRHGAAASMTDDGFFVTGGNDDSQHSSTEYFSSGQWVSGPALPVPMSHHCQVSVGTALIVTGGYGIDRLASVYKLQAGDWTRLPDMARARYAHSCEVVGGHLFVMGGDGAGAVEMMNISTQKWQPGPELTNSFSWGQAVVYRSTLFLVSREGKVVKLTDAAKWEDVASIGNIGRRPVFPAQVVTAEVLGC